MRIFRGILWFGYEVFAVLCGWPPFRSSLRRLSSALNFNREVSVQVSGHIMRASTLDRAVALWLWKFGILERFETRLVESLLKEGMIVLDIGANIGLYTLQMARRVGPQGKVFAFEPDASNFSLLTENVGLNGYGNVSCIQKAVSDKSGEARLFFFEEHRGGHRIYDSGDERSSSPTQTVALDDYFPRGQKIDLIKMDIEGAECLAFKGMRRLVRENEGLIIICEFVPELLKKSGVAPEEFFGIIAEMGLRVQLINEYRECLEPATAQELINMGLSERNLNLCLTSGPSQG